MCTGPGGYQHFQGGEAFGLGRTAVWSGWEVGWVNWMDVSGVVSRLNEASLISPSCSNSSPPEKGQLA
jgi:hypothetical protein